MGRFIGICILSDIKFINVSPKREEVAKVFHNSVSVLCSGIGIYYSKEPYRAELSGPVKLLGNLLMKVMEGSPLNRLLSIQAIDLD